MRWETGLSHRSDIAPAVTVAEREGAATEVKIDFRGLGVYLSTVEAARLARELVTATSPAPSEAEAKLAAIRKEHFQDPVEKEDGHGNEIQVGVECGTCEQPWPCATARILDTPVRVEPENDWEYGVSVPALNEKPEWSATLESARAVQEEAATTYRRWTQGHPVVVHRRRPAGPWEVVVPVTEKADRP